MSLHTDSIFVAALRASTSLTQALGGRIYGTAIPVPDEDLINEPTPYVVVTFDGLTNEGFTKDGSFEGDEDRVTIGIEVCAATLDDLHVLTEEVRTSVRQYFEGGDIPAYLESLVPLDYQLTAGRIEYDSLKPCYWQVLTYACSTTA